jgi:hypothetical protein
MAAILCKRPIYIWHVVHWPHILSCAGRKIPLNWRLVVGIGCVVLIPFFISRVTKRRGCAMPIELLVPIIIFVLGIVVSVNLSSLGIERVVEANKK